MKSHITHIRTSTNHPQTDGMAERFMRSIKGMIRADLIQRSDWTQTSWTRNLRNAVRQYNQSCHKMTQCSPFELARGRTPTPIEIRWLEPTRLQSSKKSCIFWNSVLQRDQRSRKKNHEYRNEGRQESRTFKVGDLVYRKQIQTKIGVSKSLTPRWSGPYEIVKQIGKVTYKIAVPNSSATYIVHVDHLINADQNSYQTKFLPNPRGRPKKGGKCRVTIIINKF